MANPPLCSSEAPLSITDKIYHCLVLRTTYKVDISCFYLKSPHSHTRGNEHQNCSAFLYKGINPVPNRAQTPWGNATRFPPLFLHRCECIASWLQLWVQWMLQSLCGITQKPTRYVQQFLGGEADPPFHLYTESPVKWAQKTA